MTRQSWAVLITVALLLGAIGGLAVAVLWPDPLPCWMPEDMP